MEEFNIEMNEYQTPITDELLAQYPEEVQKQLFEFIAEVPFIQHLISKDRKRAKDLPRDNKGRIIVDLANPHIVENMDYFRPSALHFKKYGCFTRLRPNKNPHSEFGRWIREEKRRCWEGYVRPSDGEWVTGYLYYYLNYSPIMLTAITEGTNRADRVEDFPEFWEGIYWRFHYIDQARNGGKYNEFKGGEHCAELAKRGAHPYFQKVYTPEGVKEWKDIKIGDYLFGTDGKVTKVIDIPYDKEAPYYKITLRDGREVYASDDHIWNVYRKTKPIIEHLTTSQLLENYRQPRKKTWRMPSGLEHVYFIPKNEGVDYTTQEIPVDAYTLGFLLGDGCFRTIQNKSYIMFTSREDDICAYKKYIPYNIVKYTKDNYTYKVEVRTDYLEDEGLWHKKSEDKWIPDLYKFNSREVRLNILKGLLDADGHLHGGVPTLSTTSEKLKDDVLFIVRSLGYNAGYTKQKAGYKKDGEYKQCLDVYSISIYGGEELFNLDRKKVLVNSKYQSRGKKTCIVDIQYMGVTKCKCVTVDAEDESYLIGDFIQTHNCSKSFSLASIMSHNFVLGENTEAHKKVMSILTAYTNEYLSGKDGTLSKFVPMIDFVATNTQFPRRRLTNSPNKMLWQMGYVNKKTGAQAGSLNQVMGVSSKDDESKLRGKRGIILFEEFGSFPRLINIYNVVRFGVEEGDFTFGQIYLVGTAGDDASDFFGAQELIYNPEGYHIYQLPNNWDKPNQGKPNFAFFFPAYVNRKGCYNKDGVSDVIKALLQILMARYNAKYKTTDPMTIVRVTADMPITPAEAMIKVGNSIFPTTDIMERILQIKASPDIFNDVYVADLVIEGKEVKYVPSMSEPIRYFPHKGNKGMMGAIEIFEMPHIDPNTKKAYANRYVGGIDPYDNDESGTNSLGSILILDLWTDRIVCEYTGRPPLADDFYEICRRILLLYNGVANYENNKKGLFAYFSRYSCTHLLTDVLEFLKDKSMMKPGTIGTNTAKGTNASESINSYARRLLAKWLIAPVPIITKDENDNDIESNMPRLYQIKNLAFLQEIASWNTEGNFDRVSSAGMLMLLREDRLIMSQGNLSNLKIKKGANKKSQDPFFIDNFDKKFQEDKPLW